MSNNPKPALTSIEVKDYLQQHPEFFKDHLSLLENLSIPHPSGEAVSLISKQLEIFRTRHHELENQLTALIDIARENDTSFNRIHRLTLALLEADSLETLLANLEHVFSECFLLDFFALRIIQDNSDAPIANLFISPEHDTLRHFEKELSSKQPKCGHPTLEQARFLFGDAALEVKSCAIIPILMNNFEGIIGIGSREKERFHYSKGSLFLAQIGEILGTRLISLLR